MASTSYLGHGAKSHTASRSSPNLTNPLLQSRASKLSTPSLLSHSLLSKPKTKATEGHQKTPLTHGATGKKSSGGSTAPIRLTSQTSVSSLSGLGTTSQSNLSTSKGVGVTSQSSLTGSTTTRVPRSSNLVGNSLLQTTKLKSSLLSDKSSLLPNTTALHGSHSGTAESSSFKTTKASSLLSSQRTSLRDPSLRSSTSLLRPAVRPQLVSKSLVGTTSTNKTSLTSSSLWSSSLRTSLTTGTATTTSTSHAMGKPKPVSFTSSLTPKTLTQGSLLPTSSLKTAKLMKTGLDTSSKVSTSTNKNVFSTRSTTLSKSSAQPLSTSSFLTTSKGKTADMDHDVSEATLPIDKPITKRTEGAPQYDFSAERHVSPCEPKFIPPELDATVQEPPAPPVDIVGMKTTLINSVATSLLCSPDFHSSHDPTRRNLVKLGEKMAQHDPEFLLKLALYTRSDLGIRTTANFLLALAANIASCRPYLKKYFSLSVRLPSDWIEIAEIYQAFHDSSLNFGALPTALRKVMATKFTEFDAYQLAKYNKDTSKRKKKDKGKTKEDEKKKKPTSKTTTPQATTPKTFAQKLREIPVSDDDSDSDNSIVKSEEETEEELERLTFTLKQLIRKIHISVPVEYVMCLVGKRYPEDPEAFRLSRLPGMWDQERAGKRMKLATPETWETQVSTKGNKAKTWEDLIDHNKLPFMAMLRNLRNLIMAGVSQKHHQWVIRKLNDERAVINSRQFPFRFFSAYDVLGQLEKIADGVAPPVKKGGKKSTKPPKELPEIDKKLLERYRTALDNALKIATCYNVKPIRGSTLILCNVGSNMDRPCTAARGLGKPRKVHEVGILLGLMCKYSCEQCKMMIYGINNHTEVQLRDGTILHNMDHVMQTASSMGLNTGDGILPIDFLTNMLVDRVSIDNLVVLTDAMNLENQQGKDMLDFLKKYRRLVNPNLLFVSVDLSGRSSGVSSTIKPEHENDIFLAGYSDQILRFIAERGDSGQLTYVDNIDKAYKLKSLILPSLASTETSGHFQSSLAPEKALLASAQHQRWRSVRVFISSTFRDMHGERDLLTRFVFPELRARAHSKQIQVYEVDLRWGVTEEDARSHKALEICLGEISRCQYFVGLLGERYGWIQDEYHAPDTPEYDWLKEFPSRRSITEVEMHHAALCDTDKAVGKAFFYYRDPSFLPQVPDEFKSDFESESEEASEKMQQLKSNILTTGLEVYNGYPCRWLDQVEGKLLVGGLEDFGQRVLHNLWNAIQRDYPDEEMIEDPIAHATALHNAFSENRASSFVGRRALLKQAEEKVEDGDSKVVILTGKPGSGKSAFMAALAQQCVASNESVLLLSHFIGAAPDSTNIASVLTRLCHEMKQQFGVTLDIPEDYTDLAKDWPEFLMQSATNIGKEKKMVILIDGIDLLEDKHNGRAMDWLPDNIPEGVVFVLSGVEGGSCVGNLRKRSPSPEEVTIGALDVWDKAEMVRRKLAKHRKTLDESPFNNQMKLLLTKKDAVNPLYLHLVCEELRVFGIFEEVTTFLKKIPTTISNLLQEILLRLEREHTSEVLSAALVFLSLVRNGLMEHELSGALALTFSKKDDEGDTILPPMIISRLLRSLQSFLQPTGQENSNLLTLAHKDIEKAVRLRYMRGAAGDKEREFHQLLAEHFKYEADPSGDGSYKGNSARAFSELPYHLMAAGSWKDLEEVVCNIHFVVAKCQLGLAQQLLEDYTPSSSNLQSRKTRELARFNQLPRVLEFKSFVSRNLHVLTSNPTLALQQAVNEPSSSQVTSAAACILKETPQPLMTWVNKPTEVNPCHMKISSHTGPIVCAAVSQDSCLFAAGFKNCSIKLYEVATGKEVHTFIGHASGITSICFVGSHGLCSASHDNTLSLWDIKDGIRITAMTGHTRGVHGCAANQSGKSIVSVSWDTTIKVWDGRSGKLVSTLRTKGQHNTPINCVSFHPEGQLIVVGSWDKTLKVWDSFNQKRIKVLKGHRSSIQACAYAPSGRHIVSASLDGEVKIWSTKSGSVVGTIVGHHSPVNSVAFTPNGQYLVTGSSDKLIKVWSGSLGQRAFSMGSEEHGVAHCLSFHNDTQTVCVGYHDGRVRKFNVQTGAELFAVKPHSAAVIGVAFHEGIHMSASVDQSIKIWNEKTMPESSELVGHNAPLTCAVWEKNGFASASEDMTILVWSHKPSDYGKYMRAAQARRKGDRSVGPTATLREHTGKITSIAFSNDGLKMVTASRDLSMIVWDTYSYQKLQTLHACHKDWINTCAFSDSSSDFLITGSNDFTLKLWDLKSGTEKSTFRGHTSSINSIAFSQGCVVSAAFDGSVKVWTHKGIEITTMFCHKQRVNAVKVNIPGKSTTSTSTWADMLDEDEEETKQNVKIKDISVITASDDGTVGVWKPFLPHEVTSLVGHSDQVLSIATTVNNTILSCSLDESIRFWSPNLSTQLDFQTTMKGHTGPVTSVSSVYVTNDTSYIVTGGRDGCVIVWEAKREGEEKKLIKLYQVGSSEEQAISAVCITSFQKSSQKATVSVGQDDGSMKVFTFKPTEYPSTTATISSSTLLGAHPISKLAVTPDLKNVVIGSWSNKVALVGYNKKINSKMESHKGWVMDLLLVEEDKQSIMYSIGLDMNLYRSELLLKEASTRRPVSIYATKYSINLDPGEKQPAWLLAMCEVTGTPYLAISDSKGRLSLWNRKTRMLDLTKKLHQKSINAVVAVASKSLVTGSDDGTVKMWTVDGKSLKQIGQFYCQSCVTAITSVKGGESGDKNDRPLVIVGDSLGHVTLLEWHQ